MICATMCDKMLTSSVSIRFSPDVRGRLESVSERSGLEESDLIRRAVEEFLERVEKEGSVSFALKEIPLKYGKKTK